MEPTPDAILTQLRKGIVDYCVLACMVAGPVYGLEIAQKLGGGRVLLTSEGTLYPLLSRLRKQGWVATTLQPSPVGPPRRYYELTEAGKAALEVFRTQWSRFEADVSDTLKESE